VDIPNTKPAALSRRGTDLTCKIAEQDRFLHLKGRDVPAHSMRPPVADFFRRKWGAFFNNPGGPPFLYRLADPANTVGGVERGRQRSNRNQGSSRSKSVAAVFRPNKITML
jgi:hypothetical protein